MKDLCCIMLLCFVGYLICNSKVSARSVFDLQFPSQIEIFEISLHCIVHHLVFVLLRAVSKTVSLSCPIKFCHETKFTRNVEMWETPELYADSAAPLSLEFWNIIPVIHVHIIQFVTSLCRQILSSPTLCTLIEGQLSTQAGINQSICERLNNFLTPSKGSYDLTDALNGTENVLDMIGELTKVSLKCKRHWMK